MVVVSVVDIAIWMGGWISWVWFGVGWMGVKYWWFYSDVETYVEHGAAHCD